MISPEELAGAGAAGAEDEGGGKSEIRLFHLPPVIESQNKPIIFVAHAGGRPAILELVNDESLIRKEVLHELIKKLGM